METREERHGALPGADGGLNSSRGSGGEERGC